MESISTPMIICTRKYDVKTTHTTKNNATAGWLLLIGCCPALVASIAA